MQVQEGGEAMLECEVGNLVGQVQWTKDGFALGMFLWIYLFFCIGNGILVGTRGKTIFANKTFTLLKL